MQFDPESRKEYLTGFRKRRQQRREEGKKQLEAKLRREKIRARKEVCYPTFVFADLNILKAQGSNKEVGRRIIK